MRRVVIVVIGVLLMGACAGGGSATKHRWEDWGTPIGNSAAEFPLLGVVHPEAVFTGGAAGFDPLHGRSAELEWRIGSALIEILTFEATDLQVDLDNLVESRLATAGAVRLKDVLVRQSRVVQVTYGAFHSFLWVDGSAVVEARVRGTSGPLGPILGSVVELEPEAFHDLVGTFRVP